MTRREPAHYGAGDTLVHDTHTHAYVDDRVDDGGRGPGPDDPIPGWRKPIALVGWGLLIAALLGLIIWGIVQLARGDPPQEPATTIGPRTPATPPTKPSSAPSSAPPTRHSNEQTTSASTPEAPDTNGPTASTENPGTPTSAPPPGAFPFPQLPSVITLPSLPGLPTEITLPPGL